MGRRKNRPDESRYYISSKDIEDQWRIWEASAQRVEDRIMPEKLGEQIVSIATHLLNHRNFRGYSFHDKEDMRGEAILKCERNLRNIDPSKGSLFAYLTMVCWSAFVSYLRKYYNQRNRKRELIIDALEDARTKNPNAVNGEYIQMLKDELERYASSNMVDDLKVED